MESTTVTISVKVLLVTLSLAGSLVGVYVASMRRDDRIEARMRKQEDWLLHDFKGGESKQGGHLQTIEKLESSYQREQGRRDAEKSKRGRPGDSAV